MKIFAIATLNFVFLNIIFILVVYEKDIIQGKLICKPLLQSQKQKMPGPASAPPLLVITIEYLPRRVFESHWTLVYHCQ